ncbi:MAG: AhpC/TSA family protein [Tannerella sp.]|jgi:peroxiredoxin|nr:AhpC/TSA family protein [Tannerella sp.]
MLFILNSCNNSSDFTAKGVVAGAVDQTLYFDYSGLAGVETLDSVKLKQDGKFKFKHKCPEYPDFYRLRLKNQLIHFSIDSTETVVFTADVNTFSTSYTVEGSENSKAIKEIVLAQLDAYHEIHKFRESYGMNLIPDTTYMDIVKKSVKSYKEIAKKYIFGAPMSPAAYFSLFQQIDGQWIFDLYDKNDSKAFGAVANSYLAYYQNSERTKQIVNLALQSQKLTRDSGKNLSLDFNSVKEIDFIDIELPDINGNKVKLSDVAKDKTVLVNFTAYQTNWSLKYNAVLNELYEKYKNSGFQIYQISLDNDENFWKNAVYRIPWVCVRDPQSVYSQIAAVYNVQQLPTFFLLNKKGVMFKRIESLDSFESDIKSIL